MSERDRLGTALRRVAFWVVASVFWFPAGHAQDHETTPRYQVSVDGPVAKTAFACDDPCEVDESTVVGYAGGEVRSGGRGGTDDLPPTGSRIVDEDGADFEAEGIDCQGNCTSTANEGLLTFEPRRRLREGMKVTIRNDRAHFIFYVITETASGPATLLQHSEFDIDRPLIEVTVRDHDVVIRTDMDESERSDRMRRRDSGGTATD